jgi:hypothetical protein
MLGAGAAAGLMLAAKPAFATARRFQPRIDPGLWDRAKAALEAKRDYLRDTDMIAIADYSRASAFDRFYLVDMIGGEVTSHLVAHGRGSDPQHSGYLDHFSNQPGSEASSAGAYVTGNFYHGKYGRSLRVKGLDRSNSNAEARDIVIHSAPYAEPRMIREYGKLGRSEGCFALSEASLQAVLEQLGPGRFLYSGKV